MLDGTFLYLHDKGSEISPDVLDEGTDSVKNGSDKGLRWMDLGEEDPLFKKAEGGGLCVHVFEMETDKEKHYGISGDTGDFGLRGG